MIDSTPKIDTTLLEELNEKIGKIQKDNYSLKGIRLSLNTLKYVGSVQ